MQGLQLISVSKEGHGFTRTTSSTRELMTKTGFCVCMERNWRLGMVVTIQQGIRNSIAGMSLESHWALQWHHDERNGVSHHQPHDCLLNRLFRRRSKTTSKLRVIDFCEGNSPLTGEFPAQRASRAENVTFDDVIMLSNLRPLDRFLTACPAS